jgi:tyrosine-protein phosphatase SIW14
MTRTTARWILGLLVFALLIGGPIAYSGYRQAEYRNFRVVINGKLYRSGQMSIDALQHTIDEYGIKTIISLRFADREGAKPPDWREEEYCTAHGIRYVRIRPRVWTPTEEGAVPAEQPVNEFLNVMDDPNVYPVLLHCFAGKHRTGALCSIYRMEYQHWTNDEAIQELKSLGYTNLDSEEDVLGYLESYVPRWRRGSD